MTLPEAGAPNERHGSYWAAGAVFTVLAVALPSYAVDFSNLPGVEILVWLLLAWSAGVIAKIFLDGKGSVVRLSFHIFVYVFMSLPVLAQISSGHFIISLPGAGNYAQSEITAAYYRVVAGVVAFEVAYAVWSSPWRLRRREPLFSPAKYQLSESRVIALGIVGILFTGLLVAQTGLAPFFSNRQEAQDAIFGVDYTQQAYLATGKATHAFLRYFAQVPVLLSLFGSLYLWRHKLTNVARASAWTMTWRTVGIPAMIVCNIIVNNFLANSRFWVGTVVFVLASVGLQLNRQIGIRVAAVASVAVLLFAFTSLQAYRRVGSPQDYSVGFRGDLVTSPTYSEFEMEMIGRRWLTDHSHTYGHQALGAVGIFVPRSLWASKPADTGNLVLPYVNPAASAWTEGDVEAGWTGIVILFAALGAGAARADTRFRRSAPGSPAHALVPVAAGYLIFVLRGSFIAAAAPAYVLTICAIFMFRRSAASDSPRSARVPL